MIYQPRFIEDHFIAGVRTNVDPENVHLMDDEQLSEKELAAKKLYFKRQAMIDTQEKMQAEENKLREKILKSYWPMHTGIHVKDPSPIIMRSPFQETTEQRMIEDKRIFLEKKAKEEEARQKEVYWPEEEKVRQEQIKAAELAAEVFEKLKIDWPERKYVDSFWEALASVIVVTAEAIKLEIKNYIISIKERYDL